MPANGFSIDAFGDAAKLLQAFGEAITDPVYVRDAAGRIVFANRAASALMGLNETEISDLPAFSASATKPDAQTEQRTLTAHGDRVYAVSCAPWVDAAGNHLGMLHVARDITDSRQREERLTALLRGAETARDEAEKAAQGKDELLAQAVHELRSPLSAVVGWLHVLEKMSSGNNDRQQRAVQGIRSSIEQQTRLVDDLLDSARIMSGAFKLDRRPIALRPLLGKVVGQMTATAEARQQQVAFHCDLGDEEVDADEERLWQVFENLLANAIKFTPHGGTIKVLARHAADRARISIMDSAVDIDDKHLRDIGGPLSQYAASVAQRHSGLGLSLVLAGELVALHGGKMRTNAADGGQGVAFTVDLPLHDQAT